MQKLIHLIILLFIIVNQINAQYILSRQVISSSGGSVAMAGLTLENTTGEAITSEIDNGSYSISQGFHQYFISTIATDKLESNLLKFYPNPVSGICYLQFDQPISHNFNLFIYSMDGKTIYNKKIENSSENIQLDLSQLIPGIYIAVLKNEFKTISSFKLIKI